MANVTGPASSTDNALVRWDGTSGTVVQDSGITLDDNNLLSFASTGYLDGSGNFSTPGYIATTSDITSSGTLNGATLSANRIKSSNGKIDTDQSTGSLIATQFVIANNGNDVELSTTAGSGSAVVYSVVLSATNSTTTLNLSGNADISGTNTGDQSDATLTFSDITTNNSSTSEHGFLKKLDNTATHYMDGTGNWSAPAGSASAPTFQYLKTGSSATYTTPANCRAIKVEAWGGGGGGGGGFNGAPTAGGNGGDTIFNSVHAKGGVGGLVGTTANGTAGGAGTTAGTGSATFRMIGSVGGTAGGSTIATGGNGGSTSLGGAGMGGFKQADNATAAAADSGSGGGGGSSVGGGCGGGGGQAGEYFILDISSPAGTYTYTIGAAGSARTATTENGKAGGTGLIIVTEYY